MMSDTGPTAPPAVHNVDQPTGVVVNGVRIDTLSDVPLTAEEQAFVDQIDMNDPSIAAVVGRWNARESAPPAPPATPDPTAPVAPHATRSPLQAPDVSGETLTDDGQLAPTPAPVEPPTDLDPAGDGGDGTEPEAPATPQAPAPIVATINGQQVEVDQATVDAWGQLAAWAGSLPDSTRQTLAAITDGHMVAIPRDEAQAFLQWREQTQGGQRQPAPQVPDFDDDDPQALRAELARLRADVDQAPIQAQAAARAALTQQQQLAHFEQVIAATADQFRAQHELDDAAMGTLMDYIGATQLAARIRQERMVISPTNQVLSEPDPGTVFAEALTLAHRHLSSFARPAADQVVEQRLEQERQTASKVDAKKNAQAALASTAPAAVTQPQRDPASPYAHQGEMQAGIAAELAELLSGTPDGVLP